MKIDKWEKYMEISKVINDLIWEIYMFVCFTKVITPLLFQGNTHLTITKKRKMDTRKFVIAILWLLRDVTEQKTGLCMFLRQVPTLSPDDPWSLEFIMAAERGEQ